MGDINIADNRQNFKSGPGKHVTVWLRGKDAIVQKGELTTKQDWVQSHFQLQLAACPWVGWL